MPNNGKICVSVSAATAAEMFAAAARAADSADVVELRFDALPDEEIDAALALIAAGAPAKPVLATFRPEEQGGLRRLTLAARVKFFERFLHASRGRESYVDFEPDLAFKLPFELRGKIVSTHDFAGVPENLETLYETLAAAGGIVKIAVRAADAVDAIPVWRLLARARAEGVQIAPIAMGEAGKWTRVLGLAHGAALCYAAPAAGAETAPGQVSAHDLRAVYRAGELDAATAVYGILGGSTAVSLSPFIHNAAFRRHGLNAVFVPFEVHDLDAFVRRMVRPATREVELDFRGFSVTIPHKQSIVRHLDEIDATAARIGAVNTVKIEGGRLTGYNTDAKGFIDPLLNSYGELRGARVAVLGAGGAARACVYALGEAGAEVTVYARDRAKAAPLAAEFGVALDALEADDRATPFGAHDILVNTTPLGMKGKYEGRSPAEPAELAGLDLVYDLVYTPFQTALMAAADAAEVPKIGGLAMLVAQAMEQSRIWTGREAPMKEMSRAALARLG